MLVGQVLAGTVTALWQFNAYVQLDGLDEGGIVNISQLSNSFDPPPISEHLSVGDRVAGVCVGRDDRTARLEISPRRLDAGVELPSGKLLDWEIVRCNEFESVLKHGSTFGILQPDDHSWSRYRVLLEGGVLAEGSAIAARATGSKNGQGWHVLALPSYQLDRDEAKLAELVGEIILWRPDATRKKDEMLRNILYVHTERGYVFRVECNDVLAIDEHFSIGDAVRFRQRTSQMNGIPIGELAPECRPKPTQFGYVIGQSVNGKVTRLLPGGAIILVADCNAGYLPASSVLPGKGFIGSVLKVGDWIEAEISELGDAVGRVGVLSFIRLARESEVSMQGRDPLVDLRSERRRSTKGGFGRDASFRLVVTNKYEHVCCCCGESYRLPNGSAMEAAHIIPRGKRGADHLSNGLCLCPIHHWAFDRGLFTIGSDLMVSVAAAVRCEQSGVEWLVNHHGRAAAFPNSPEVSLDALGWHRLNIFLGA